MRLFILIVTFLMGKTLIGQTLSAVYDDPLLELIDPIKIQQGQEPYYFKYAEELYSHDSLQQAGQIFYRLFRKDSLSKIGESSNYYLKQIELQVTEIVRANLLNAWICEWTGSNWNRLTHQVRPKVTKRIVLQDSLIAFYIDDSLTRETKYYLTQSFNWFAGEIINLIEYVDTKEQWYFDVTSLFGFTSDRLRILQRSNISCGHYGETYKLDDKKQQLTRGLLTNLLKEVGWSEE